MKPIIVLYPPGGSGMFVSSLLQNLISSRSELHIAPSGHCHHNYTAESRPDVLEKHDLYLELLKDAPDVNINNYRILEIVITTEHQQLITELLVTYKFFLADFLLLEELDKNDTLGGDCFYKTWAAIFKFLLNYKFSQDISFKELNAIAPDFLMYEMFEFIHLMLPYFKSSKNIEISNKVELNISHIHQNNIEEFSSAIITCCPEFNSGDKIKYIQESLTKYHSAQNQLLLNDPYLFVQQLKSKATQQYNMVREAWNMH